MPGRVGRGDVGAVELDAAGGGSPQPDDGLDQLGLPVALDPGDGDDLAGADVEGHVGDGQLVALVADAEVRHAQHHVRRCRLAAIDHELHVPPDHR